MIHPSYEIVKSCENCKCVYVEREPWEPDVFYCNSDDSKVPDPEEEEEDEYEHWTITRHVSPNGICDNYRQNFNEMTSTK